MKSNPKSMIIVFLLLIFFSFPMTSHAATVITQVNLYNGYDLDSNKNSRLELSIKSFETYTFTAPPGSYVCGFSYSTFSSSGSNKFTITTETGANVTKDFGANGGSWLKISNNSSYYLGLYEAAVYVATEVPDEATIKEARDRATESRDAAISAKTSADTAANRAQTTINQTWYSGAYGGSSENVANLAGYIRIPQSSR